jgi:inhibitor of KinA sporulation pathway (predicted exonuclease)
MASTQKHFVFDPSASMDGNHHRALGDKRKTLGLVKKMAREMKCRVITGGF